VVREFLTVYPDPIEVPKPAEPERPSFLGFVRMLFGTAAANEPETAPARAAPPVSRDIVDLDLLAASHLCTKLAQADIGSDVTLLLHEAARILDAVGMIVWTWDPPKNSLTPAIAAGYSERVVAQLPDVARDADNATAAAFRSGQTRTGAGGE